MTSLTDFLLARIAEDEADCASGVYAGDIHYRVLAECEAKRRIVEQAAAVLDSWDFAHGDHPGLAMWPDVTRRERAHANNTLRALARPFADHPDYREEWA